MATADVGRPAGTTPGRGVTTTRSQRLATETKAGPKTTEFFAYIAMTAGVLIAGLVTKAGGGHDDRLTAQDAWLFAAILTVGYMISRGLAKSGSREPYYDGGTNENYDR